MPTKQKTLSEETCSVSFKVTPSDHLLIAECAKNDDRTIASFVKLIVLSALKVKIPENEQEKLRLCTKIIATMIAKELANEQQPTQ